jgi:hypothetical protein
VLRRYRGQIDVGTRVIVDARTTPMLQQTRNCAHRFSIEEDEDREIDTPEQIQ